MPRPTGSPGEILSFLHSQGPMTISELMEASGQARSTVSARLDTLVAKNLVGPHAEPKSTGGRRSAVYSFTGTKSYILSGDLSEHSARLAIFDLQANLRAHWHGEIQVADGPRVVIAKLVSVFSELLASIGGKPSDVVALGLGLPAPVDHRTGRVEGLLNLVDWEDFDVVAAFESEFDCLVGLDNDANILAIGEQRTSWPFADDFMYIKISEGIAAGIISSGTICRGNDGLAGDIGHIYTPDAGETLCVCGKRGCLGAYAGAFAIGKQLQNHGLDVRSADDVVKLSKTGLPILDELIYGVSRSIGKVLASCASVLNPRVIVIGGELSGIGQSLLTGVTESLYAFGSENTTRHLDVVLASQDEMIGVTGAAHMMLEDVLDPANFERVFG